MRPLVALVALVAATLYVVDVVQFWGYALDDQFITYRYARNWAAGLGPVWNPGEYVEGTTSPLWLFLLTAVTALSGPAALPVVSKVIGAVAGLFCLGLVGLLTARLVALADGRTGAERASSDEHQSRRRWLPPVMVGALAMVWLAVEPGFTLNAVNGLETGAFALVLTAAAASALWLPSSSEGAWRVCVLAGLAWAVAYLLRPETPYLFLAWGAGLLVVCDGRGHRAGLLLRMLAVIIPVGLAHLALRYATYGEWLPNTYYAKQGGDPAMSAPGLVADAAWPVLLGPVGLALAVLFARRVRAPGVTAWVTMVVAGMLLPFVEGPDWMIGHRQTMAVFPLGVAVLAAALAQGVAALSSGALPLIVLVLVVGGLRLAEQSERGELLAHVGRPEAETSGCYRAIAERVCALPDEAPVVALTDIGQVGWHCPRARVVDISGLTDRFVAKSPGRFLAKQYDPAYVFDQEPDVVVLALGLTPPPGPRILFETPMDTALFGHPRFEAFRSQRQGDAQGAGDAAAAPLEEQLRAMLDAEKVCTMLQPYPGYFLATFVRSEDGHD